MRSKTDRSPGNLQTAVEGSVRSSQILSMEGLTRKEVVEEHRSKGDDEEFETRYAGRAGIIACVKRVQVCSNDQVVWPYHRGRPDKQSPRHSGEPKASHLRCHCQQESEALGACSASVERSPREMLNFADLSENGSSSQTCAAVATCNPVIHTKETFVMIAITVCSLMLKGPGLRSISNPPSQRGRRKVYSGSAHAIKRPIGYATILLRGFSAVRFSRKRCLRGLTARPMAE